jgi:hypothetical protein
LRTPHRAWGGACGVCSAANSISRPLSGSGSR